jgi:hypothetical protein
VHVVYPFHSDPNTALHVLGDVELDHPYVADARPQFVRRAAAAEGVQVGAARPALGDRDPVALERIGGDDEVETAGCCPGPADDLDAVRDVGVPVVLRDPQVTDDDDLVAHARFDLALLGDSSAPDGERKRGPVFAAGKENADPRDRHAEVRGRPVRVFFSRRALSSSAELSSPRRASPAETPDDRGEQPWGSRPRTRGGAEGRVRRGLGPCSAPRRPSWPWSGAR